MAKFDVITGRYVYITVDGKEYRIYFEEAGQGIPLLLGHTAGSDGRQYRFLMNDEEVTRNFRCIAFDMPYHGKSLPPLETEWWKEEYNLTLDFMIKVNKALIDALGLDRPVYLGTSMGGHLAVDLALYVPEQYRAVIGLQSALCTGQEHKDRSMYGLRKEFDNPNVNNATIGAAMLANTSPSTPEAMVREIEWGYQLSGPGVFAGDLYYYTYDHNVTAEDAKRIDTSVCKTYFLTGEYDYNTPPEMTQEMADCIEGSWFKEMKGMGHFPATENYPEFRNFLLEILKDIQSI